MFRAVPLSIIKRFSLYTQQWCMSYRFADSLRAGSCSQAVRHIPLLCVQWKTPDDGQRNCPKHVEFYSKNKLQKLVHLVGFIIRVYHEARSPERQSSITSVSRGKPKFAIHRAAVCFLLDSYLTSPVLDNCRTARWRSRLRVETCRSERDKYTNIHSFTVLY